MRRTLQGEPAIVCRTGRITSLVTRWWAMDRLRLFPVSLQGQLRGGSARAHPGGFAIVKPVDPDDPAVAKVVADWKKARGTFGIRVILTKEAMGEPNDLRPDPVGHGLDTRVRSRQLRASGRLLPQSWPPG
jgi:hypothetical protein